MTPSAWLTRSSTPSRFWASASTVWENPRRSQNMTVSCRYSARSGGSAEASEGPARPAPQVPQNRNDSGLADPQ